jgi:hypothetical protein
MSIEDRLARLERENRRLKVTVLLVLMLVATVFLMGQARPPTNSPAEKFSLIRPGGGVLGAFTTFEGKPWLVLYDSADTETNDRANVGVTGTDLASVWVRGHGNDGSAQLSTSRDGQPWISLQDTSGRTRIRMTLIGLTQDPRIEMMDQAGTVTWSAP